MARAHQMPLAVLNRQADWITVIERLRALLGAAPPTPGQWDLFEIATTAAEIAGGPVTIEDAAGRVVGYGGDHSSADATRVATILSRRVPADVVSRLTDAGVFRDLRQSHEAVYVDGIARLAPPCGRGDPQRAGSDRNCLGHRERPPRGQGTA